jgi:hypothetical protein
MARIFDSWLVEKAGFGRFWGVENYVLRNGVEIG